MTPAARWLTRAAIVILAYSTGGSDAAERRLRPIALAATPIASFLPASTEQQFGQLEFRGGLELTSPERQFGSLSGLDFSSDGETLYAVADTGRWFAARPVEKDGRLVGLTDARMGPILNGGGVPLSSKAWGDAEALRIVRSGGHDEALVTFEEVNDLRQFAGDPFVLAGSRPVDLPRAVAGISRDRGLEALAVARPSGPLAGATVLIAERSLDAHGNHRGWIVGGPRAGTFSLKRTANYDVTDAVFLPDGALLVLERSLLLPLGFGMRIRRIAEADLAPGALVDGEVLIEADFRYQIDNMEGLAVRTNAAGETIVAIVSDNNGSLLQRTLLLYFALVPPGGALTPTATAQ